MCNVCNLAVALMKLVVRETQSHERTESFFPANGGRFITSELRKKKTTSAAFAVTVILHFLLLIGYTVLALNY